MPDLIRVLSDQTPHRCSISAMKIKLPLDPVVVMRLLGLSIGDVDLLDIEPNTGREQIDLHVGQGGDEPRAGVVLKDEIGVRLAGLETEIRLLSAHEKTRHGDTPVSEGQS